MSLALQAGPYSLIVDKIVDESPGIRTFRLRFPAPGDFSFLPGQFVMLSFPDAPRYSRAYSIGSSPLEKGFIDVTLNKVAKFTARMFELQGGETLVARGPYGKWVYTDDIPHAVLISGGTGVTPFRCISRYVIHKGLPNRITILYSTRTPTDIIYRQEFQDLARRPNFKVVFTVTRPQLMPEGQSWEGAKGRFGVGMIEEAVPDFYEATYFLCGPNQLVRDLSAALAAKGVPAQHIRREKWGEF